MQMRCWNLMCVSRFALHGLGAIWNRRFSGFGLTVPSQPTYGNLIKFQLYVPQSGGHKAFVLWKEENSFLSRLQGKGFSSSWGWKFCETFRKAVCTWGFSDRILPPVLQNKIKQKFLWFCWGRCVGAVSVCMGWSGSTGQGAQWIKNAACITGRSLALILHWV